MTASMDRLDELVRLPRNPKLHDLGEIHQAYDEFGFLERVVINDVTGRMIAGHGRVDALQQRKASGAEPPGNVGVAGDDMWLVPADHVDVPEEKEEAAALALNKIGELGGWDEVVLASVLADITAQGGVSLAGTGFDEDDLDGILRDLAPAPFVEDGRGGGDRLVLGPWVIEVVVDQETYKLWLAIVDRVAPGDPAAVMALSLQIVDEETRDGS